MKNSKYSFTAIAAGMALLLLSASAGFAETGRFRIEAYGGVAFLNPRDFNLLAKAEEQYNYILFQERLLGVDGYFTNDFPGIKSVFPAGLRIRYGLNRRFDASIDFEAFRQVESLNVSGSYSYSPSWSLVHSKTYDPFKMGIKAMSVMAGLHYRINPGKPTEVEIGAAAGWAWARFDFRSSWTSTIFLAADGEILNDSVDGATLEGDGRGNAPAAKLILRLNQALGRRWGFFVETAAVYCRMNSLSGGGRETRLSIPGESVWQGTWAIKKEEIEMPYDRATVFVPTNWWEGWVAGQRERDFALDISSLRLHLGFYLKF